MAELLSHELRVWVEANTTFPNTMVDRITPMTEAEHIELVARSVLLWQLGACCRRMRLHGQMLPRYCNVVAFMARF